VACHAKPVQTCQPGKYAKPLTCLNLTAHTHVCSSAALLSMETATFSASETAEANSGQHSAGHHQQSSASQVYADHEGLSAWQGEWSNPNALHSCLQLCHPGVNCAASVYHLICSTVRINVWTECTILVTELLLGCMSNVGRPCARPSPRHKRTMNPDPPANSGVVKSLVLLVLTLCWVVNVPG